MLTANQQQQVERFENAWQSGQTPNLQTFLTDISETGTNNASLLLFELIVIDLEYRWQRADAAVKTADDPLPLQPTLDDYVTAGFLDSLTNLPTEIIAEEYRIRHLYGDRPEHREMLQQYLQDCPTLSQHLNRVDKSLRIEEDTPANDAAVAKTEQHSPVQQEAIREQTQAASSDIRSDSHAAQNDEQRITLQVSGDAPPARTMVRKFGEYELLEEIASGGMGIVYKARHVKLDRIVALKTILSGQLATEEQVRRFEIEAEAAAKLDHPGIVPIHEVGECEGVHFFSMGFVEGTSLADHPEAGSLEMRQAAEVVKEVAVAVQYAHARNIVHRDLKPANVLLDEGCQPKVTDFGLAKIVGQDSGLTATGLVMGTPAYMPPEQASGKMNEVGPLADVYSLGAILFFLLTKRPPFHGASAVETLRLVVEQEADSPQKHNAKVDLDLATICLKCLRKEPERRYPSAAELAEDLQRWLEGKPIEARPVGRVERLIKWGRRNKALSASIGIAVSILLVVVTVSYVRIAAERNRAIKGELAAKESESRAIKGEQQAKESELKAIAAQQEQWATALAASKRFAMQAVEQAELHQLEPAKRRAAEARLVAPAGPWALFAQGEIAMARADYPQATQLFQQAADNPDGDQPEIRAALAEALAQQGVLQNAEELLTNLDEIDDWRILLSAGRTLYASHKWDACQQPLARAIELMNKERDRPQENLVEAEQLLDAAPVQKACEGFYEEIQTLPLEEMRARLSEKMTELHGENIYYKIEGDLKQGLVLQAGKQKALKYLYPFRNLPFVEADLQGCTAWELSPFEELSLTRLHCNSCVNLRNIDVLSGMKSLVDLDLSNTDVDDLSPLAGLNLRRLRCIMSRIDDLTPLVGMPLEFLDVHQTNVADLTPLKDMPLTELRIGEQVRDLSPVRGMQLEKIFIFGGAPDLSPLAGMPLTYFEKVGNITSLEPLRGMPLETFKLRFSGLVGGQLVEDFFSPLAGMPLKHVDIEGTWVNDVSALQGAPLEHLDIKFCRHIKSLEPLRDSPVSTLKLWGAWIKDPSPLESMKNIDEQRCPWVPYLLGKMTDEELGQRLRKLRQRGLLHLRTNHPPDEIPRFVQLFKAQKLYGQGKRKEALDEVNDLIDKWGATYHRMEWQKWLTRELAEQQKSGGDD